MPVFSQTQKRPDTEDGQVIAWSRERLQQNVKPYKPHSDRAAVKKPQKAEQAC